MKSEQKTCTIYHSFVITIHSSHLIFWDKHDRITNPILKVLNLCCRFRYNFGTLGLLDWLHGTDEKFKASVQFKRHKTMFGFTPFWKAIPN